MATSNRPKLPTDPLHEDIQRLLIGRRSAAIGRDVLKAADVLRRYQESVGHQQDRTPAQTEMLSSIPPITAFMGMGG